MTRACSILFLRNYLRGETFRPETNVRAQQRGLKEENRIKRMKEGGGGVVSDKHRAPSV